MSYSQTVGRVMAGDYDGSTPEERSEAVRELITVCATAAGAVAIQPFPLLDVLLVSPIQIALVQGIGRIYGHRLDQKAVLEMMGTFGASLVAQNVMMAAAKLVPFAGWVAGAAMAYATTWAIGEVADHYFKYGRGVPADDLRDMFRRVYDGKKRERESAMKAAPSLKERLEQLNEARAAGLIDEEEYSRKKEEILAAL
jgi:uncharacterized protein (DUF697 family)